MGKNRLSSIHFSRHTIKILDLPFVTWTRFARLLLFFFEILGLLIGSLELNRALQGWKAPGNGVEFQDLNDDYFPGDVDFDPLGLKPEDADEFFEMSSKELQHGRLAMLGVAGIVAQELVNGKEIFVNLGLAADRFDPSSVPIQF